MIPDRVRRKVDQQGNQIPGLKIPVTNGTGGYANPRRPNANIDMCVAGTTKLENVAETRYEEFEPCAKRPQYTRGLPWDTSDDHLSVMAQYSLTAAPVPWVPDKELENKELMDTISTHLHLFKVNCPILVNRSEELLVDHPNQPFVKSVCRALREGFWPFVNTRYGNYPTTWDFSKREPCDPEHADFIAKQVEAEVLKGRYSEDFGSNLLPGMYLTPVHAVPKPGTDTYWLINDQSAGEYSPNSMIHPDDITGMCMDGIKSLGTSLLTHQDFFGDEELVIFKADIKEVYHPMWMCPEWQAKQVITVGVKWHVDFCNCYSSQVSYKVFLSFTSLIAWIAEHVRQICNLKIHIDDNAGFGPAQHVLYYEPYKHYFLTDQTKLLLLWDELGIPHEERKQIYGPIIPFIGFDVDPNAMTFSISDEHHTKLINKICGFAILGKRYALKDFQALGGHVNWSLAVFPLSSNIFYLCCTQRFQ